jgi:hypothetical protein
MTPLLSRRNVLRSMLGGGAALALSGHARALPAAGDEVLFRAYRNGDEIGWHRLAFSTAGERLLVEVEIRFDVTFAFITVYSYRHRSRETWQGPRLVGLDTTTKDGRERFAVKAAARGGRLVVETAAGEVLDLPGNTLPTSYWHERTVGVSEWLDTQSGRLMRSTVERLGMEPVETAGASLDATRYRLEGDLSCELWYADQRWCKLRFIASDGSTIDYLLESKLIDHAAWTGRT